MVEEVQKHSVHTLVFRSLKRTHDMFVSDHAKPISADEKSYKLKMNVKLQTEYSPVLHMPILKEIKEKCAQSYNHGHYTINQGQEPEYVITGTHPYPSGPGVALTADTQVQKMPSEASSRALALIVPPSKARYVYRLRNLRTLNGFSLVMQSWHENALHIFIVSNLESCIILQVISGHLGWVRCLAVEPGNQWFVTGSADRTIKIWDLASGKLKLSLTGHISTVRGVAVSSRSPYLFSCGEDKQVKCWDLEYNKVIRHYHGHLSAVYGLDLHPTIDVLITCGRDSTARVWDIRTKANVHTLSGHTNTVATVKCQAGEPQIITGSHDTTIRLWDLVAGKTRVTLTNHKKSVRSLILHPRQYTFASGSPDNIKQWKCPDGVFIQNLPGHNAIINTLSVNSDGVLVSGADNGTMHLWDWRTGYNFQRIHAAVQPGSLDSESGIFACTFDQSESRLLTAEADKTIKVYKEDDMATEETHPVNWKPEIIKRKRF
ncbi:pleiotropic regulator 1 [Leucoraja erinacea]|uniref:pleiotropic regulator 1 n=1 Tax=Leucoraja erinaceus TaxID=7782 RepID=UPI002458EAA3|nr:pleiotropic regulator 1 [Leucoraja erinacea]